MNLTAELLDIVKLAVAGVIVFFIAWLYIKEYLDKRYNFKILELKKKTLKHTLPLRLQAYERLILLLERINPASMLVRLHTPGMSARDIQAVIIADIRAEFQHNISQQLYVNAATWTVVKKVKDDTISLVNSAVNGLPENATSVDLSRSILLHLANMEEDNPYDIALNIVKQEAVSLF